MYMQEHLIFYLDNIHTSSFKRKNIKSVPTARILDSLFPEQAVNERWVQDNKEIYLIFGW